jgi:hypothetical protein
MFQVLFSAEHHLLQSSSSESSEDESSEAKFRGTRQSSARSAGPSGASSPSGASGPSGAANITRVTGRVVKSAAEYSGAIPKYGRYRQQRDQEVTDFCVVKLHLVTMFFLRCTKPVFVNVYGARESIPRNRFRQPM